MFADRHIDIRFDCLPMRLIEGWEPPVDASPRFQAKCERIKAAAQKHGLLNTYFLHDGVCRFHLSNQEGESLLHFAFEGTVTTDAWDERTVAGDLQVDLKFESCAWITEPVVAWLRDMVARAVMLEFDRYIAAGDLTRTKERLAVNEMEWERRGGYVGMGL